MAIDLQLRPLIDGGQAHEPIAIPLLHQRRRPPRGGARVDDFEEQRPEARGRQLAGQRLVCAGRQTGCDPCPFRYRHTRLKRRAALQGCRKAPDADLKAQLVALRGIGEWSAEWFLARHLARPRAWPVGDVGLRKAVAHFYGDADERAARSRFEPFENLSAHYLLAALYAGVGA